MYKKPCSRQKSLVQPIHRSRIATSRHKHTARSALNRKPALGAGTGPIASSASRRRQIRRKGPRDTVGLEDHGGSLVAMDTRRFKDGIVAGLELFAFFIR